MYSARYSWWQKMKCYLEIYLLDMTLYLDYYILYT